MGQQLKLCPCLHSQEKPIYFIRTPVQIWLLHVSDLLPAKASGRQWIMTQALGSLLPTWEICMEFLVSGFCQAWPPLLWTSGERTSRWKTCCVCRSLSPTCLLRSLSLYVSNTYIHLDNKCRATAWSVIKFLVFFCSHIRSHLVFIQLKLWHNLVLEIYPCFNLILLFLFFPTYWFCILIILCSTLTVSILSVRLDMLSCIHLNVVSRFRTETSSMPLTHIQVCKASNDCPPSCCSYSLTARSSSLPSFPHRHKRKKRGWGKNRNICPYFPLYLDPSHLNQWPTQACIPQWYK